MRGLGKKSFFHTQLIEKSKSNPSNSRSSPSAFEMETSKSGQQNSFIETTLFGWPTFIYFVFCVKSLT